MQCSRASPRLLEITYLAAQNSPTEDRKNLGQCLGILKVLVLCGPSGEICSLLECVSIWYQHMVPIRLFLSPACLDIYQMTVQDPQRRGLLSSCVRQWSVRPSFSTCLSVCVCVCLCFCCAVPEGTAGRRGVSFTSGSGEVRSANCRAFLEKARSRKDRKLVLSRAVAYRPTQSVMCWAGLD